MSLIVFALELRTSSFQEETLFSYLQARVCKANKYSSHVWNIFLPTPKEENVHPKRKMSRYFEKNRRLFFSIYCMVNAGQRVKRAIVKSMCYLPSYPFVSEGIWNPNQKVWGTLSTYHPSKLTLFYIVH